MKLIIALTAFFSIPSVVWGRDVDIEILDVECDEDMEITPVFTRICVDDVCAFGALDQVVGGSVTLAGLEDTLSANSTTLYFDASLSLRTTGANTVKFPLLKNSPFSLCGLFEEGDCPADGTYDFNTTFNMPNIDNDYYSWAAAGWTTTIALDIKNGTSSDSAVVGACLVSASSVEHGKTVQESKGAGYFLMGLAGLLVASCGFLVCCTTCCKSRLAAHRAQLESEEEAARFQRMEDERLARVAPSEDTGDFHIY